MRNLAIEIMSGESILFGKLEKICDEPRFIL
jgi:hypothetical protein